MNELVVQRGPVKDIPVLHECFSMGGCQHYNRAIQEPPFVEPGNQAPEALVELKDFRVVQCFDKSDIPSVRFVDSPPECLVQGAAEIPMHSVRPPKGRRGDCEKYGPEV